MHGRGVSIEDLNGLEKNTEAVGRSYGVRKTPLGPQGKGARNSEEGRVPKAAMGVNRNCLRLGNTGTRGGRKYLAGVGVSVLRDPQDRPESLYQRGPPTH